MIEVLFTSDLHLGHALMAEKRGFSSVEEHDESIYNCLKKYCHEKTLLWVLGDVAMSLDALKKLGDNPSRMKLIRGNHDQFAIEDYLNVFEDVHGFLRYKKMWMSHCPIHPQELVGCELNLHGHIHKDAFTKPLDFPYINVNWDFWGRPVRLYEIRKIRDENVHR